MKKILITLCSLVLALASAHLNAAPLGTAFTYQGRLTDGANPANGTIPMVFGLWDAEMGGINVGTPTSISSNVTVANGLFTIDLDFGATAFSGDARWLEIRVNGTLMTSRQRVAPTPNALYASTAGTVKNGAVQADQLGPSNAPALDQVCSYNGSSLFWQTPGGPNLWSLNGNNDAYYNGGKVGIGTSVPVAPLEVFGNWNGEQGAVNLIGNRPSIRFTGDSATGNQSWLMHLGGDGPGNLQFFRRTGPGSWANAMTLATSGNVGIGSINPASKLEVIGAASQTAVLGYSSGSIGVFGRSETAEGVRGESSARFGGAVVGLNVNTSGGYGVYGESPAGVGVYGNTRSAAGAGVFGINLNTTGGQGVSGESVGGVGVYGKSASFEGIHGETTSPTFAAVAGINLGAGPGVYGRSDSGGYGGFFIGKVRVGILEIAGGADLAEPFPVKGEAIEKGSVVVIDDEHPGHLKCSTRAYDTRVAGIVSGANGINPGIALHQEGAFEGGQNVALSGRVYVQADASSSSIKPGDLLTTSNTPGHAMKVTDHAKAQGAIIGKAMSALKEGKGMVLVLVTLQ